MELTLADEYTVRDLTRMALLNLRNAMDDQELDAIAQKHSSRSEWAKKTRAHSLAAEVEMNRAIVRRLFITRHLKL